MNSTPIDLINITMLQSQSTSIHNNSNYFSLVDYSLFGILLAVSASIGLYFGCFGDHDQTTEEYLLGGHKMKTIPIAISLVASQLSAISIMTIPAEIYSFGWQYGLILPILTLVTAACNYIYIPVFYHNNIDNCYAYLEMRFNKTVRNIVTSLFLLVCFLILPIILFIPSLAFSQVTGLSLHLVNSVVCYVCVFYTMLGGIKAVVWTDVVQAAVMVVSIVLVAIFGIKEVGGLQEVWDRNVAGGRITPIDFTFDLTTRTTFWNLTFGIFTTWSCHVGLNQSCVQRIVSLPTLKQSQRALVYFCIGVIFIMFFNCFTGIIMFAYYYGCDPIKLKIVDKHDKLVPLFVQNVAGHISGMPGVFISCVFSASLSTVSATMNSLAGIIYVDYMKPMKLFQHTESNANHAMKIIVVVVGTFCVLAGMVVDKFNSLFQLINTVAGAVTGGMFGVFTLGMLYPRANATGVIWGLSTSFFGMLGILANSQIKIANDVLKYDPLPTNVDRCLLTNLTANIEQMNQTVIQPQSGANDPDNQFAMYKISFLWYSTLGTLIMYFVSILISHLTGSKEDLNKLNVNLLSPWARILLPKKLQHTEMAVIQSETDDESSEAKKLKKVEHT